jgi:hypothetical protein
MHISKLLILSENDEVSDLKLESRSKNQESIKNQESRSKNQEARIKNQDAGSKKKEKNPGI